MANTEKFTNFDPAKYGCCRQCCEYIEDEVEVCLFCRRDPKKIRRFYSWGEQHEIRIAQKERLLKQLSEGRHVSLNECLEFAPTGKNIDKRAYFSDGNNIRTI